MLASICGQTPLELGGGEVLVAVVDGLELAAVDGHQRLGKQIQPAAQHDELAAHSADGASVVLAEVGDGLEVGREPPGEPHQLEIALRFALEPAARGDAVQIAVDIQLEQHRRVIAGASGGRRGGTLKPQLPQIELLDERFDDTHRVVLGHIIVQARRQQSGLASVLAFNESLHPAGLAIRVAEVYEDTLRFYTGLYGHRPSCQVDLHVMPQRGTGCSLISGLYVQALSLRALMEYAKNVLISATCFSGTRLCSGLRSCGPTCLAITR